MSDSTYNLKSLRELAGLSQEALGRRLTEAMPDPGGAPNYAQPRIAAYEQGRNKVPLMVAQHLVAILNKSLKEPVATLDAMVHPKHRIKIKRGRPGAKKAAARKR
jgi:transcriptional regulator with XRE-family HTH domain